MSHSFLSLASRVLAVFFLAFLSSTYNSSATPTPDLCLFLLRKITIVIVVTLSFGEMGEKVCTLLPAVSISNYQGTHMLSCLQVNKNEELRQVASHPHSDQQGIYHCVLGTTLTSYCTSPSNKQLLGSCCKSVTLPGDRKTQRWKIDSLLSHLLGEENIHLKCR